MNRSPNCTSQPWRLKTLFDAASIKQGRYLALKPLNRFSLIPRVHAEEIQNNETQTSMDRLASMKRPAVVVSDEEVFNYIEKETGMDRLRIMYEYSDTGALSAEMDFVVNSIQTCGLITFGIASIYGARSGKERAIVKMEHQKFEHKIKAVRRAHDASFIGGFKVGLSYAVKMSLFVGCFTLTSCSISAYRNKTGVTEYAAAGAVTGALSRFMLGPKGMVGGGAVGGFLGLLAGGMVVLMMKSANETYEQRHYWYIHEKLREKKELQEMVSRALSPPTQKETS